MENREDYCENEILFQYMEEIEETSQSVPLKKQKKKPKVLREWEEMDVFKLIALVESEKCLWDASDEAYHNKALRDRAWRNIKDNFDDNITQQELNAKWTNLRKQFRGYAGRMKTKSGQGVVESPKWKFYNAMSFVGRAEEKQTQKTVSNIVFDMEDSSIAEVQNTTQRKQQIAPNQLASTQIIETMREAVSAIRERKETSHDPDHTFATYLESELNTLIQSQQEQ